jgi:hypothetical protein
MENTMKENKELALRMVQADIKRRNKNLRAFGDSCKLVDLSNPLPDFDSDDGLIMIEIGARHELTVAVAKHMATQWRRLVDAYPRAEFTILLLGFDEDPREIWEIPSAAKYVRQWAKFAGIHSPKDIGSSLGFLAACGVFGEAYRRRSLANIKPTKRQ